MPLYEYKCEQCQQRLEAIQRFSEDPYTICPHCGGPLKKLISSPAIKFKGSGFYITDYGKSGSSASTSTGSSKSSESTSTPAAGSGTSGSGSGETK